MYLTAGWAKALPVERPATTPHNPLRVAPDAPANPRVSAKAAEQLNNVRPAQGRR